MQFDIEILCEDGDITETTITTESVKEAIKGVNKLFTCKDAKLMDCFGNVVAIKKDNIWSLKK